MELCYSLFCALFLGRRVPAGQTCIPYNRALSLCLRHFCSSSLSFQAYVCRLKTIWCCISRVAIMANHSSSNGSGTLAITAMILVLLTSSLAVVEGMRVTLENDMTQAMSISCHSTKADLGTQLVSPGLSYIIDNIGSFTSGLKYTCTFVASGKAITTIDVFVGWGGVKNLPCNCLADTCPWLITAIGFSCNAGTYSRTWG